MLFADTDIDQDFYSLHDTKIVPHSQLLEAQNISQSSTTIYLKLLHSYFRNKFPQLILITPPSHIPLSQLHHRNRLFPR